MAETEGVIKFQLRFKHGPAVDAEWLSELNAWRDILYMTRLVGRDPTRYAGYSYGNVSRRLPPLNAPPEQRRFVISGTQTSHLAHAGPEHYTTVLKCHVKQNEVVAEGPVHPSSECLTHGMLYALDDTLRFILHVHSPDIWRYAETLGLPSTRPEVAYGTPDMADEVARLFAQSDAAERRIFAMRGHEDGIVAFGETADEAGLILIKCLARALQLN